MMMTSKSTRLPAPEQLLLVPLNEIELAELIEKHIEFVDDKGRAVHLPSPFVKHYLKRDDGALPIATSIAQLPIVLDDGTILTGRGLNRKYGIVFRVPEELDALMPSRSDCTSNAVAGAMQFLTDEWLSDVAADYKGKCVIIACALTVLERALLPERPAFFITSGGRGNGKTSTIHMISMAAVGLPAAAAAWSSDPEERRKALFSYLEIGLAMLAWDNIPRGTTISCPSIEKALTTEFYTDRVLGTPGHKTVATYTVMIFTGNNIGPRGDLCSRTLGVRLDTNRIDPENRKFKHRDPMAWINTNRGAILQAFYTILLGNPRRTQKKSGREPEQTRFKPWWNIVGSAVENAAAQHKRAIEEMTHHFVAEPNQTCPPQKISFKTMFLEGETDEEESSSLAVVLDTLITRWPVDSKERRSSVFQASDVAGHVRGTVDGGLAFKAALEMASGKPIPAVSAPTINWRLQAVKDRPDTLHGKIYVLRYIKPDRHGRNGGFRVVILPSDDPDENSS
jgi:hypothetical protein